MLFWPISGICSRCLPSLYGGFTFFFSLNDVTVSRLQHLFDLVDSVFCSDWDGVGVGIEAGVGECVLNGHGAGILESGNIFLNVREDRADDPLFNWSEVALII